MGRGSRHTPTTMQALDSLLARSSGPDVPPWVREQEILRDPANSDPQRFLKALAEGQQLPLVVGGLRWQPGLSTGALRRCLAGGLTPGMEQIFGTTEEGWTLYGSALGVTLTVNARGQVARSVRLPRTLVKACAGSRPPQTPEYIVVTGLPLAGSLGCMDGTGLQLNFPTNGGFRQESMPDLKPSDLAAMVHALMSGASLAIISDSEAGEGTQNFPAAGAQVFTLALAPDSSPEAEIWEIRHTSEAGLRIMKIETDKVRQLRELVEGCYRDTDDPIVT